MIFLQIMTSQNKSSAATYRGMLSNNTHAASPELFSQRSHTSPSMNTNPERELAIETPDRRSQRNLRPHAIFDFAQVQQEKKQKREGRPAEETTL